MLSAQRMLHLLYFQFQRIQGAEDFLHAICVIHVVVRISIINQLAGINVSPGPLGGLDRQWLDDLPRRALGSEEKIYKHELHGENREEREERAKKSITWETSQICWVPDEKPSVPVEFYRAQTVKRESEHKM